jgi:CheY-like chemotaxis protein
MSAPETSTPRRVLVAEDDPRTGRALTALLERHAYEVTVAADGQAALELLMGPSPPSLALLDWEMPRLDGLHVVRAIRSIPADRYTYLIMVTARDAPEDTLAAFAAGVDDYLSKPVDAAQLLARLRCGERVTTLENRLAARVADLERTLDEVRTLKRLLPICMYCKKIRDDGNYWEEIESYLHTHTGSDFSHGICPQCFESVVHREMPKDPVARRALRDRRAVSPIED